MSALPQDTLDEPEEVAVAFAAHIGRTGLAAATKRAYAGEAAGFCTWLQDTPHHRAGDVFTDPDSRDFAARDYRRHLLTERKRAPKGVDLAMTAVTTLFTWLGMPGTNVPRHGTKTKTAPRALSEDQARAVLRAATRRGPRDFTIILLGMGAGLRLSEIAALDCDDVWVSARKGQIQVRAGKGDRPRTVPMSSEVREGMEAYLAGQQVGIGEPLFRSRSGDRLSARSIGYLVNETGKAAGVALSPHVLRHTFGTRLVRGGVDMATVAELMGHSSMDTTRVYSRPTADDSAAAVEVAALGY